MVGAYAKFSLSISTHSSRQKEEEEEKKKGERGMRRAKRQNPLDFADGLRWNCTYNYTKGADADAVLRVRTHIEREEHWRADAVMRPYVIRFVSFYSEHPLTHARHEPNSSVVFQPPLFRSLSLSTSLRVCLLCSVGDSDKQLTKRENTERERESPAQCTSRKTDRKKEQTTYERLVVVVVIRMPVRDTCPRRL